MKPDTLRYRDAIPRDILEVLRESHRHQLQWDPEAEPADLSFDSTVSEWQRACDLLPPPELGPALRKWFGVPIYDWQPILTPESTRTLRDVCCAIAQAGAQMPFARPAPIAMLSCKPAGTFFAVLEVLRDAGADVEGIRPSTPLNPFVARYTHVLLNDLSQLNPGVLPPVRFRDQWFHKPYASILPLLAILAAPCCWLLGAPLIAAGAATVGILSYLVSGILFHLFPPWPEFPGVDTFRDLAVLLTPETEASQLIAE